MSILTSALLPRIEKRLPEDVIGPATHGMIDYAEVVLFFGIGLLCRRSNKAASTAAFGVSAFLFGQSLLTDYPMGVRPVISFEDHGKMDAAFAASSWIIPKLFGFSGTTVATVFALNAFVAGAVVKMTDFDSERAKLERAEAHIR